MSGPYGLAIDLTAGRIYWANVHDNTIRGAPLAGGGSVDTLYGPAEGVNAPYAVAIDPADAISIVRAPPSSALARWVTSAIEAIVGVLQSLGRPERTTIGRIYWTNNGDNTIRGAELAIRGAVDVLYGGPGRGVNWPYFLAVLRAPVGTAAPAISGGAGLGQPLSCSRALGRATWPAPPSFERRRALRTSGYAAAPTSAVPPSGPSRRPLPAAMPAGSPPSIGPGAPRRRVQCWSSDPGSRRLLRSERACRAGSERNLVLSRRRARYACVL